MFELVGEYRKMESFISGIVLAVSIIGCVSQPTTSTETGLILTPYIKEGRIEEAKNASEVDPKYFLNITSFSGFLTVDEKHDSNLFFWFFPKEDLVHTAWIIWLQGGPGVTSLYGVFDEIGPFQYTSKEGLKLRNTTWYNDYSLLFIDNPVGAGYSFTSSDQGYATSMETYADHLYKTIQQFLAIFPELRKAPLYIAGESYAGHYVPAFANEILKRKPSGNEAINLQGIMMGNPILERENIANISQVFYQWGLIDSQGLQAVKSDQEAYIEAIKRDDAVTAQKMRNQILDKMSDISAQPQNYNVLQDELPTLKDFGDYLRLEEVMKALHIGTNDLNLNNEAVQIKLIAEFLTHVRPMVQTLLDHYRVLVYCGQLDLIAPCMPNAEMRRKKWHWSHRDEFLNAPRTPWWFNESLAGYVKSGGGLTEVLVRGAGHLVPRDKGAQAQQMVSYFIRGLDFDRPPNYEIDLKNTPPYTSIDNNNELSNNGHGFKSGMIVSIAFNVLLICGILGGILYYRLRWRRQQESWLYSGVNDDSLEPDSVLSLS